LLASAGQDAAVLLWDVETGNETLNLRRNATLVGREIDHAPRPKWGRDEPGTIESLGI
jgi:hypothetical protein